MGRRITRLGGRLAITALLAVVLVGVAYGVDRWMHRDRVGRNVTVAGFVVADGDAGDVARVLRAEGAVVAAMPVTIRTDGFVIETTSARAGISIDEAAVTAAALDVRSGEGVVDGFRTWWRSLFEDAEVGLEYQLDSEVLRRLVEDDPGRVMAHPQPPSFSGRGGGFEVVAPVAGSYLNADDVIAALGTAVAEGPPPYTVDIAARAIPTTHTQADLDAALGEVATLARQLSVSVNGRDGIVVAEAVQGWIDSAVVDGKLTPVFNTARVDSAVEKMFDVFTDPLPEPRFTIDEGEVHVDVGLPARRCCAAGVGSILYEAASSGAATTVELPTVRLEDDGGLSRADSYGITEMISTFTTKHACCAGRVANIHRIADLVRGQIIMPGETLSINDFIGRRTRANGFVAAGVIQSGHFTDQVGGGISQFATTTFNAAFFGGLDMPEYQSHSIYISRYPYGREATLSFPLPDLELTNNTPYAVMVWPHYTGTTITVEMWSTKFFDVEQTRQTSYKIGRCTRVNTYRQRIAPDGSVIDDSVFATYRPGEGLDCNGNATPDPEG